MTIVDMIEGGITFQGKVEVRVWTNVSTKTVFSGDGDDLDFVRFDNEPWMSVHPVTFLYPFDGGYVIEVDGEEED